VIIYFRKEIQSIIISATRFILLLFKREVSFSDVWKDSDMKLAFFIIIGTIPTAIIGLLFNKVANQLFSSIFIVGCALIVTGVLLWITCMIKKEGEGIEGVSVKSALLIGFVQGLAITPGISRSGSTIAVGLLLGLNRETAARYSFLLSIPAILGAEIISLKEMSAHDLDLMTIMGTITAGVVGYCALKLLVYIVKKGQMHLFFALLLAGGSDCSDLGMVGGKAELGRPWADSKQTILLRNWSVFPTLSSVCLAVWVSNNNVIIFSLLFPLILIILSMGENTDNKDLLRAITDAGYQSVVIPANIKDSSSFPPCLRGDIMNVSLLCFRTVLFLFPEAIEAGMTLLSDESYKNQLSVFLK